MTFDIDAIRQREQAAEPAPWRVVEEHGRDIADEAYSRLTVQTAGPSGSREIAELVDPDHSWSSKLTEENAEFIAHARTDVPALLAKVDELTAELERMRAGATPLAYLIWSNHHKAWWAPNSRGYRSDPADAGRYTLDAARQEMTRGCACCPVPEVPVPAEKVVGAGDRSIRGVIAAATRAAVKAGQGNKYYEAPKPEVAG